MRARVNMSEAFSESVQRAFAHIAKVETITVERLGSDLSFAADLTGRIVSSLFSTGLVQVEGECLKVSKKGSEHLRAARNNESSSLKSASRALGTAAAELEDIQQQIIVHTNAFRRAQAPESHIIVGRRGTGKTLLSRMLKTDQYRFYSGTISVATEIASSRILQHLQNSATDPNLTSVSEQGWRAWLWAETLCFLANADRLPRSALPETANTRGIADVSGLFDWLMSDRGALVGYQRATDPKIEAAMSLAEKSLQREGPLLMVVDTLERHPVYNELHEALVGGQLWASFMMPREMRERITVKCFVRSEIYNYALLRSVPNPMKLTSSVLHLFWTSRELAELAAKRIQWALPQKTPPHNFADSDVSSSWNSLNGAISHLLPESITDRTGSSEQTFIHLLRHTQMAPRHVILALKSAAESGAAQADQFPIGPSAYLAAIDELSARLAFETINAAQDVYPQIEGVIQLLDRNPQIFKGSVLDKLWHQGGRSIHGDEALWNRDVFRQVLLDSGVIGVVTQETHRYAHTTFQFSSEHRLAISDRSLCAVHPIFATYLRLPLSRLLVLPRLSDAPHKDA